VHGGDRGGEVLGGGRALRALSAYKVSTMISVKEAVQAARDYAREVLGDVDATVEEIERESYKKRGVWKITLGFPSKSYYADRAGLDLLSRGEWRFPSKDYKSILIDVQTGEPLAMKIRELTA
jgi:hypothetical protein